MSFQRQWNMRSPHLITIRLFSLITFLHCAQVECRAETADKACGPRAAWYILKFHSRDVELIDAIREIQWPDLESGTSIEKIKNYLSSHDLHCETVALTPPSLPISPYPSIIYQKPVNGGLGHFLVLAPWKAGEVATVWDGPGGYREIPARELVPTLSGIALVASPDSKVPAISNGNANRGALAPVWRWTPWALGVCSLCLFLFVIRQTWILNSVKGSQ